VTFQTQADRNLFSLVSVFPAGINVGATWSKRLAYERGKAMGLENRDKGITVLLGPVAGGIGRVSWRVKVNHMSRG
jgi:beta-glucosidase-like glycosyl hydrolase